MKQLLFVVLVICCAPCIADEAAVYESIDDASIGPVFLTPSQRRWLDERRLRPQVAAGGGTEDSSSQPPAAVSVTPAGFIISSNGQRQRWKAGEFVAADGSAVTSMSFPGDVPVVRHEPDETADVDDEADNSDGQD